MIAHSCGLHGLDNTISAGFKSRGINKCLLQPNDKSVRVSIFLSALPWTTSDGEKCLGFPWGAGEPEQVSPGVACLFLKRVKEECERLDVLSWQFSLQVKFINKVGVSITKSNLV